MQSWRKIFIITYIGAMKNKIISTIILGIIICSLSTAAHAEDLEKRRQELWDITKQLKIKRQQLETIKQKQGETLRNLAIINRRLNTTQQELNYADYLLQHKEKQIQSTKQELTGLKEAYVIHKNIFQKRIREIYKENRYGYLILLFSAETLGDFLNRTFYFEKLLQADVKLLQETSQKKRLIEQKEDQLKRRYSEINNIKSVFEKRKGYYRTQQINQNKVYSEIAQKRQEYERQIAELERNSKEIENMLLKLIAEGKTSAVKGTGKFSWPVRGQITSHYGYRRHPIFRRVRFHSGLDIGVRSGTKINAADAGQVIFAGWWGGYGKATIIDHGNGYSTVYAHQSNIYVKKNQYVKKGQAIGTVGTTGYTTGPHLHFEIRKQGKTLNPLRFL